VTGEPRHQHGSSGHALGPRPSAEQERALVGAAQQGDRDALATLLRLHEAQIYATCVRMLGDREQARDLTQDTMVRLIEALHGFDGRARFATWMTRIAMNVCLSHLRKQRLRRHASLDGSPTPGDSGTSQPRAATLEQSREPAGGSRIESDEQAARLSEALGAIDPEARAILILRDMRGLDYKQIAETLEVALGTVKSRIFRARAALREAMERLESPEASVADAQPQRESAR
jgi:RNA polymerase sigma-70 factor (ECF subfamily)